MGVKHYLLFLLLSLLALCLLLPSLPTAFARKWPHPSSPFINAIFQFGDSFSDTGNLIRYMTGAHILCDSLPYGETLHKSTGRCSDGLLMVDYFARFFHFPLLDPYLNKGGNFRHGVNFAVAGSTALDTDVLVAKGVVSLTNNSLSVQLKWFNSHLDSICRNSSVCKQQVLHNSLVLMGEIGGNDYNFALYEGKSIEELQSSMVPEVVQTIKEAVIEVINLGANRVVVPGNFPIGCMPGYLTLFESNDTTLYDELGCLKGLNDFAKFHNDHLQEAIKELQPEYPNVAIAYGDYYSSLRGILANARSEGFDVSGLYKACCGMNDNNYNVDKTRLCGGEGVPVCANPAERVSWDGIHLTQHANHLMAIYLLKSIATIC